MPDHQYFSTNRSEVVSSLSILAAVIVSTPIAIIWLFGHYISAAVVVIMGLFFLYPKLSKYFKLLFTGQALVLGEENLYDRTFPLGRVPWSQIEGASLIEVQDHKVVELNIRDEDAFREEFIQRTWLYRPIRRRNFENGRMDFWIDTHLIDGSPDHVLQAIRSRVKTTA